MRVFSCGNCGQAVYFDNVSCESCGVALGFDPVALTMKNLFSKSGDTLKTTPSGGVSQVYCDNYARNVCNWLVPAQRQGALCPSCSRNRMIPDLTVPGNAERWFEIEKAKRRVIYELLKFRLPVENAPWETGASPMTFDIVADAKTGHQGGIITINLAEANPAIRERTREQFDEPYRTLLGHFRHEIGHYYWTALIGNSRWLPRFRELFGNETIDYANALAAYHQNGPRPDWARSYISAYAASHPWEDWAESWAHYLHMVDALETAADYKLDPRLPYASKPRSLFSSSPGDPRLALKADDLIDRWIPLALAMNSLNRSMGLSDFYPFVISPSAAEKLNFIHMVAHSARSV